MKRALIRIMTTVTAGIAVVALAACASVPASGPVNVGRTDLTQAERLVQVTAFGPSAGATQEQLVRGFLIAANASADDYAVAREFLSREYTAQWDPHYGVLVYEGTKPYRAEGESGGVLSLSITAKVDSSGKMLPAESGASTELPFEFVLENGEWRISAAPSGIILDRTNFVSLWSDQRVTFFGPGGRLVPETRWFLSRAALVTEIVGSLLAGPSERLGQVVHSGFPPGATLTNSTVPVVAGLARVEITGDNLDSPVTQKEMLIQLQSSLQGVPGLNKVELLVNGAPVKEIPETETVGSAPGIGARVAGSIDGKFGVITGQKVEPVTGISGLIDEQKPEAVALSRSKTVAVTRSPAGITYMTEGFAAVVDSRSKLLDPSIDNDFWAWSYSAADPGVVRAAAADGRQLDIPAQWLESEDVHSLRVSPGGSLIAALVTRGDKSAVVVAGVIRESSGAPTGFSEVVDVEMWANGTAVDFDWVSATRFVALTQVGSAGKVTVGGPGLFASERGSVPEAEKISGGGSEAQIRVLNANGELFSPQGSGWQRSNTGVSVLAKRG